MENDPSKNSYRLMDDPIELGDSSSDESGRVVDLTTDTPVTDKTTKSSNSGEGERPTKRARLQKNEDEEEEEEDDDASDFSTGDVPLVSDAVKTTPATNSTTATTTASSNSNSNSNSKPPPSSSSVVDPTLLEHAKSRLSKWAARLFDPDRPRGLVQAPETIPLNDEHLKAFGERVKQELSGEDVTAGQAIGSDDEDGDDDDDDSDAGDFYDEVLPEGMTKRQKRKRNKKASEKSKKGIKVKISNMSYRTDTTLLRAACDRFGALLEVHLVMDKDNPALNSGRAYVTFQLADDAQECVDHLKELGGRKLRLSLASERPKTAGTPGGGNTGSKSFLNRFWDKDITTICFRCGEVGHYDADCKNPAKPRPCALCGSLEHQDRRCEHKMICFNCGCAGHSVRDCPERRGLPRRLVCGICFESGHHRNSCRNYRGSGATASRDAICMDCGQQGHFLCRELKWFFGLKGISCFNCGAQGHSGFQCQRPNVFQCRDEPQIGTKEIERAEVESV
jgi:cellular nucleic acid-binding protein